MSKLFGFAEQLILAHRRQSQTAHAGNIPTRKRVMNMSNEIGNGIGTLMEIKHFGNNKTSR